MDELQHSILTFLLVWSARQEMNQVEKSQMISDN